MTIDPNPVPVLYTDEELDKQVRGIIANMEVGDKVSFNNICAQIIRMAEEDKKLKPNTEYTSTEIQSKDQMRISAIMWDLIIERKVYTIMGSYRWFVRTQDDTIFVVR